MTDRFRPTRRPPGLPLAELHCHLEGTVKPELALELGRRHGIDLSAVVGPDGHYIWRDFGEFLTVYEAMTEAIRTPEDYYDLTLAYYRDAAASGLIYGEVFAAPILPERAGIAYPTFIDAVAAAMRDAEAAHGIAARIILTCVRHYGADHAEAVARLAEAHPHPSVVGFGMAGDEAYGHAADYARAFAIARGAGLKITAHAGEIAGADSVRDVIEHLTVERIGHGVRASEDPALVEEIKARGLTLEVCPGSNLAIGVYPGMAAHPLMDLKRAGLKVTLSSDDPPFFHTDIAAEYDRAAESFGLTAADLLAFTAASIDAAFCDAQTRDALRARVTGFQASGALSQQN